MKAKISCLFLSFFLFANVNSHAQYLGTGSNWYFGDQAGITWTNLQTNSDPMYLMDGQLISNEGVAAMSDASGNLLFYTDGYYVWNSIHQIMTNSLPTTPGAQLSGNRSSTQAAIIVPKPLDPNTYYIFTTDADLGNDGLRYSRVDMTADGGLGNIDLFEKNVPLLSPSPEKITTVRHSNGFDSWVITHQWNSNQFNVYQITSTGVQNQTPVISNIGLIHSGANANSHGYMKASPSGSKIALAIEGMDIWQLFNFNNSTGIVTNAITLDHISNDDCYGVEFSIDEQFLYGSERMGIDLHQWNISLPTPAAIIASHQIVATLGSANGGALQLGPDQKIYLARNNTKYLGRIIEPSLAGSACNYVDEAILLGLDTATAKICGEGLPTSLTFQGFSVGYPIPVSSCNNDTVFFEVPNPIGMDTAYWNFNFPSTDTNYYYSGSETEVWFIYPTGGVYTTKLITKHGNIYQTFYFNVYFSQFPELDLGSDTTICDGDSLVFDLSFNDSISIYGYCDYLWEAQLATQTYYDSSSSFLIDKPGMYTVTVYADSICGSVTDVINVDVYPTPIINFGADTILFSMVATVLDPQVTAVNYAWSDGSSDSIIAGAVQGMYSLTVTDINGCMNEDSVFVLQTASLMNNVFESQILIFPNPARDKLYISSEDFQLEEIQIFSSTGKLITQFKNVGRNIEVETQTFSDGIYFIKILTKGNEVVVKPISVIK